MQKLTWTVMHSQANAKNTRKAGQIMEGPESQPVETDNVCPENNEKS